MNPLDFALDFAARLDRLGVPYVVGGSLAASISGEPRSTVDIDMAVRLDAELLAALATDAEAEFYVPLDLAAAALDDRSSFNLIHHEIPIKIDLFVLGDSLLDRNQFDRRRRVPIAGGELWVTAPEDMVLRKMWWYRLGGEVSDRQWRDILGLLRHQSGRLDDSYLDTTAVETDLVDLLDRARADLTP